MNNHNIHTGKQVIVFFLARDTQARVHTICDNS